MFENRYGAEKGVDGNRRHDIDDRRAGESRKEDYALIVLGRASEGFDGR
jgi:hypothetical protein